MSGRLLIEPTSPFVIADDETIRVVPDAVPPTLLFDLLGAPDRVVERLLDPARLESALLGSLSAITVGTALFAVVLTIPHGPVAALRAAVLSSIDALIALAAALGPIWAAGILASARLPLSRLVGALSTSAASGALILAALAPVPYFLCKWDDLWAGPLSVVLCFALSAMVAGKRLHGTLLRTGEAIKGRVSTEPLDPAERHRIGVLARIAMLVLALTGSLAVWGFDAFLVGG